MHESRECAWLEGIWGEPELQCWPPSTASLSRQIGLHLQGTPETSRKGWHDLHFFPTNECFASFTQVGRTFIFLATSLAVPNSNFAVFYL